MPENVAQAAKDQVGNKTSNAAPTVVAFVFFFSLLVYATMIVVVISSLRLLLTHDKRNPC